MNMIGHAVDDERGAVQLADDSAQVRVQAWPRVGADERQAVFGAEYQVREFVNV